MSKNIIIQEGGTGKQMTVNKLKTDKVGGGSCLWVSEDEVSLGTKSISANGTYKASDDGKYGFSQVTVNVAGGKGSADNSGQPISSGGDPDIGSSFIGIDPTDGEPYEYTVNPQGEVEKTPVPITTPSDTGSSFIGIDPTDGELYEYTVNPQGEVEKTPVPITTPGGIGSSVIGKDTSGIISGTPGGDGNEYAIGIDSNGSIVATKVPSGIEIGKSPDKTSYTEGEVIDYSGIIVILKGGDSAVFSNTDYPNGRVPFNELFFPTTEARLGMTQVPVKWNSPYSGKTFEAKVTITVSGEDTGLNWTANPSYLVYQAGTILGKNNYGTYTKQNDGYAVALWEIRANDNQLPILMSSEMNYAKLSAGPVYKTRDSNGNTWYIGTGFGEQGQGENSGGLNTISSSLLYADGNNNGYNNPLFVDLVISTCGIQIMESGSGYSDNSGGSSSGGGTSF